MAAIIRILHEAIIVTGYVTLRSPHKMFSSMRVYRYYNYRLEASAMLAISKLAFFYKLVRDLINAEGGKGKRREKRKEKKRQEEGKKKRKGKVKSRSFKTLLPNAEHSESQT
eukprot:scaffold1422_cov48-Attheya_sp.AAC.1